jgi:hypothetical protein
VAEGVITDAHSIDTRNAALVYGWEQRHVKWVALFYDSASVGLARRLFCELASSGVPVWMDLCAGAFASVPDRTNHGLHNATLVCPLVSRAFKDDSVCKVLATLDAF